MLVFFENTSREKSIFCIFRRNTIRILFLFRHVPVDEASAYKPLHKNGNAKGAFCVSYFRKISPPISSVSDLLLPIQPRLPRLFEEENKQREDDGRKPIKSVNFSHTER